MADPGSSSTAPPAAASSAEQPPLVANVQIVSPSVGVNGPLSFPGLAASTTVSGLKQRVRDALPTKPLAEQQRLIYNGRLLSRENETLLDVFGEHKLRDSELQIVHLVIRDPVDHHHQSSAQAAPAQGPSPPRVQSAPVPMQPQAPPPPHGQPHGQPQHIPPRFARYPTGQGPPNLPFNGPPYGLQAAGAAGLAPGMLPPPQQLLAHQHQTMVQWMNQIQREANYRQMVNQGQQARAALGLHGIGDPAGNQAPPTNSNPPGAAGPVAPQEAQAQTFVREGFGSHGEHWQVTVNGAVIGPGGTVHPLNSQAGTASAPTTGHLSTADVQNILRTADANHATSMMTNAMHRSASGASLANLNLSNQRQPIQAPGVTVPRRPGSTAALSRTATPDPTRAPSQSTSTAPAGGTGRSPPSVQPEVYILSSPNGPRALLIHNQSDIYYTPPAPARQFVAMPPQRPLWIPPPPVPPLLSRGTMQVAQPPAQVQGTAPPVQQPAAQQGNVRVHPFQANQGPLQPQQAQFRPLAGHPNNPEAGALLAAIWPHIWLLIRLAAFVWWFTSSDTSWYRWFTIMFIATAVFIINTGLLNGVGNQVWEPLRRHLDGLLPVAGADQDRNGGVGNAAAGPQPPQGAPNAPPAPEGGNPLAPGQAPQARPAAPDPAHIAARLVAGRQEANANWLMDQVRRIERAGLLFLASIAPGVAERHIAHLEAEQRAERERREAAERAAAEAAAANAAASGEGSSENAPQEGGELANGQSGAAQADGGDGQPGSAPPPEQRQPSVSA